ncbi:alpha/beta fold hydrolase [Streptomyces indicus]|uniref:Alpha/beta hydrolase family protein n=1 Tax=Streptomyces indicus TaxID=417292 RepID=A0A1G8TD96_9ACTN|nr:alpha/beta hydrolase [Streptomyces indicus]SDJ39546.1 Alpha/beta hydrolase family protein [Streptomyces indicus]
MKLHVHERGDGDKVALLVHGGMSDHRTWHAVEEHLVGRGYRVLAPDLRGHGLSGRGAYRPELLAGDLVESLPAGADVAIGHSLGGLSLALAVPELRPRRAVYSDPGFQLGNVPAGATGAMRAMVASATADSVRAMNPRWSEADIAAELAGFALFDAELLTAMGDFEQDYLPPSALVPSLVQLADPSLCVDAKGQELLRERGFEVRVVPGAGHCIHRDDLGGFLASLDGWI